MSRYLKIFVVFLLFSLLSCNDMIVNNDELPIPTNVQASTSYSDRITVTWTCSGNANRFIVYRAESSETSGSDYTKLAEVSGFSYDDTESSLVPGKSYYYRVASYTSTLSQKSNLVGIGNLAVSPLENVAATIDQEHKIVLSWTVPATLKSSSVEGYVSVYYSDNSSTIMTGTKDSIPLSSLDVSYDLTNVTIGQEYYIKTKVSVKGTGESDLKLKHSSASSTVTGKTALTSPRNVTASKGIYSNGVRLSWDKAVGANSYVIKRGEDKGLLTTYGTTVCVIGGADTLSYTDVSILRGQPYRYVVLTVASNGTLDLNFGKDDKGTDGEYLNMGYANYTTIENRGVSTDIVGKVVLNYKADLTQFDSVYVQLYRRNYSSSGSLASVGSPVAISDSLFTLQDASVSPGKKYYYSAKIYRLSGTAKVGESGYSDEVVGWCPLGTPQNLVATDGESSKNVKVSWNKVSNGVTYHAYIGEDSSSLGYAGSTTDTVYTFTNAFYQTGKIYYFKVRAYEDVYSEYSNTDSGWIRIEAPSNLNVSERMETSLVLTWNSVKNAQSYVIARKSGSSSYTNLDTLSVGVTSYTDTGLTSGASYTYKLYTVSYRYLPSSSSYQWSEASDTLTTRTLLAAPVLDSVSGDRNGTITAYWRSASSISGLNYKVYRQTDSGGYTELGMTTSLQYTISDDSLLVPGKVYTFGISAVYDVESDMSITKTGYSRLDSPYSLTATAGTISDTIRLTWYTALNSGAQTFYVMRSKSGTNDYLQVGSFSDLATATVGTSYKKYTYNDAYNLEGGQNYDYKIQSYRSDYAGQIGVSEKYSNVATGRVKILPPDLYQVDCGKISGKITVYFKSLPSASPYRCYYSTDSSFSSGTYVEITQSAVTPYSEGKVKYALDIGTLGLKNGQLCYFKMAAVFSGEVSALSDMKPGFSLPDKPVISSPATKGTLSYIDFKWNKIENPDNIRYEILRIKNSDYSSALFSTTDTFFNDTTVDAGFKYIYRCRVVDQTALNVCNAFYTGFDSTLVKSLYSDTTSGYVTIGQVTGLTASMGKEDSVLLTWNPLDGEVVYDVQRRAVNSATWTTARSSLDTNIWIDSKLYGNVQGYSYYYRIKSYTNDFPTNYKLSGIAQGQMALLPPQNVVASKGEYGDSIKISWDSLPFANSYSVLRIDRFGATKAINPSLISDGSRVYFYNFTDLKKGEGYIYLVKANLLYGMGSTEYSDTSTTVLKTSATGYTKLPKVLGVVASQGTYRDSILIYWDKVGVASSYSLYRYYQGGLRGEFTLTDTIYQNKRSDGLSDGQIYNYVVIAKKGTIESISPSDPGSGYLKLYGPSSVTASQGLSDSIVISWDTITVVNVDSYYVYREDNPNVAIVGVNSSTKNCTYNVPTSDKGATLGFFVKGVTSSFGTTAASDVANGYCLVDSVSNFKVVETDAGTANPKAQLTWISPDGADSIRLQIKTSASWDALKTLPKSTTSYIDSGRRVGMNIQYRAQGIRTVNGIERNSKYVYANISLLIPTIAFDTISKGDHLAYVYLTWPCLPTKDEVNFQIFVYADEASYNSGVAFDTLTVVESGSNSYAFKHSANTALNGFTPGKKYFYKIRTRTLTDGEWSELTPLIPIPSVYYGWTKTPAPILDSASTDIIGRVRVKWKYGSFATDAQVRAEGFGSVDTSYVGASNYLDKTGIFSGQYYTFTVRAINTSLGDTSDWSNSLIGMAQLGPPTDLFATKKAKIKVDTVQLTWSVSGSTPNYGAEKYIVERGLDTSNFRVLKTVEDNSWNTVSANRTITYNDILTTSELGKMYYYRVYARGGAGNTSAPSKIDSGWAKIPAPEIIDYTGYNGSMSLEADSIRIKWSDPCSLDTSSVEYKILVTMNGVTATHTKSWGSTSFSLNIAQADRYQGIYVKMYSVRDTFGTSLTTDSMLTYTILPVPNKRDIISSLTASEKGVSLNYKGISSWVDSIVFFRKVYGSASSTKVMQVENPGISTTVAYEDNSGLILSTVYGYSFKLYSKYAGYSGESDTVEVKTKIIPPGDFSVTRGESSSNVFVNWTSVASGDRVISYNIYADTVYHDFKSAVASGDKIIHKSALQCPVSFTIGNPYHSGLTLERGRKYYFTATTNETNTYTDPSSISVPSNIDSGYISISAPIMDSVSKGAYSDSIVVRWKACKAYAHNTYVKYRLYWSYDGGTQQTKVLSSSDYNYDGTYVSYVLPKEENSVANLLKQKVYTFNVRGLMTGSAYTFEDSSEISSNSLTGWLALEMPENFEANYAGYSPDKIQLRWSNPDGLIVRIYESDDKATLWDNFLYSAGGGITEYNVPIEADSSRGVYKYFGARFYDQIFGLSNVADTGCQDTGLAQIAIVNITRASQGDYIDSILVYWDSLPNVDQYNVRVEDTLGTLVQNYDWDLYTEYKKVFKGSNLVQGQKYYFKVRARNSAIPISGVEGDFQSVGVFGFTQFPQITGVTATDGTLSDRVRIQWTGLASANEYVVYRSEDTSSIGSAIATVTTNSHDDTTSLVFGKDYFYRVLGSNSWTKNLSNSKKNYSDLDTGWIKLPTVTNISASDGTLEGKILVSWDQLSQIEGYYIDTCGYGLSTYGTIDTMTSASVNRVYYSETDGLQLGRCYYFKVRAFTGNRSNSLSDIIADSGYMSLGKVQNVRASQGTYNDTVRVIFNKVTGYTDPSQYQMQRYSVSKSDTTDVTSYASFAVVDDSIVIKDTSFDAEREGFIYKYRVRISIPSQLLWSEWSDWGLEGWSSLPVLPISVYDEQDSLKVDTIKIHWDTSSFAGRSASKIEIQYGADTISFTKTVILNKQEQLDKGYLMLDADNYITIKQGQVFYFRAKIYRTEGTSEITSAFSALDSGWYKLKKVEMSTMGLGEYSDSIYVSWIPQSSLPSSVLSAMTYEIFRGGVRLDSVTNGKNSYYDSTGISQGSSFFYSIRASHEKFKKSDFSDSAKGYATILTPVMDTVKVDGNNLKAEWTYNMGMDIDSLYLYRLESENSALPEYCYSEAYVSTKSAYSWIDSTCEKGKDYFYCVRAYKSGLALSDTSDIKSNYIDLDIPVIDTVSRGTSTSQIIVQWRDDEYADSLSIMRDTLADFSTAKILDTVNFTKKTYTDSKDLQDGKIYYYKIKSIRGRFTSDTSKFVAGFTKYSVPAFGGIVNNEDSIQVKWNTSGSSIDSVFLVIGNSVEVSSPLDSVQLGEKEISNLISKFASPLWFVRGKEYYIRIRGISNYSEVMREGNTAENFAIYSDFIASKVCYSSLQIPQIEVTQNLLDTVKVFWNKMPSDVVSLVRVEWKLDNFGVLGDSVYREINNNENDTVLEVVVNSDDYPLLAATKYNFRVKFSRGNIASDYSDVDTGWTKLPAPTSLAVSRAIYDDSLRFTWNNYLEGTDKTKDSTYEYVLEYENSSNYTLFKRISDKDSFYDVVYNVGNIPLGVETKFRVRGVSRVATRIDSVTSNLPTATGWTKLLPPIDSVATLSTSFTDNIIIKWAKKLTDADQITAYNNMGVVYQVERRKSTDAFIGSGYQTASPCLADSFIDSSNLWPQYNYYYRVRYYSPYYYNLLGNTNKSVSPWVEIKDSGHLKISTPTIEMGIEGRYYTDSVLLKIKRVYGADSLYLFRKAGDETNYIPWDTVIFPSTSVLAYGAKTYYIDSKDIVSGQAYSYKAVALAGGRISDTSNACSAFTLLGKVSNVKATDATSDDSVLVSWDTIALAEFYDIRVETESGTLLGTVRQITQDSAVAVKKIALGGLLDYGIVYRFGVVAKNKNCVNNGDTIGSDAVYDKGFLRFTKPTITALSKDSVGKIKIDISYPNPGFTFDVYRSPDTAYYKNTATQYDKYKKVTVSLADSGNGGYQCVDYTSVTNGTNGIKYAYFVQATKSTIATAISDSTKSYAFADASKRFGYSKIDAYSGDFTVENVKSTDSLVVSWSVPAIASKLDSIKYKWIEYKDDVAKDSGIVKTTQVVRDTSTNDRGIKYVYRIRLLAFDKGGDNYTTSSVSNNYASSWMMLDTPVIVFARNADSNNVISITNGSLPFELFKTINGETNSAIKVAAGGTYVDSVLYEKYNVGKHVSYKVRTYSTNGNLSLQSPMSVAVDTYYYIYPPKYLDASAGKYENKIALNWAWTSDQEKAHVDSFIIYRYNGTVLSKRFALIETDLTMISGGDSLFYYDSDGIKQGISYKYGITTKRKNIGFADKESDTTWNVSNGHATFSAPQNLTATKDAKRVTIKWIPSEIKEWLVDTFFSIKIIIILTHYHHGIRLRFMIQP